MAPTEILLNSPLDMHLHLREGAMLEVVAPLSAAEFAGAVIMPNLVPPVASLGRVLSYREEIEKVTKGLNFAPFMTAFMRPYSRAELEELKPHIIGIKLYPQGVTTNSSGGVRGIDDVQDTIGYMSELGIPLLVHGETHGFVMDREAEFLPIYARLASDFPNLQIVMEHITTAQALHTLDKFPNLAATVTAHHLFITLDDMAGGHLNPHLFCKPIAKRPTDREALVNAVVGGHPKIMFGSDSAPHDVSAKECAAGCAGVFTAPLALPLLVELFVQHGALANLQAFVSDNARRIYGVMPPAKGVRIIHQEWIVPNIYGSVVPYRAGETLAWQVAGISQ